MPVCIIFKLLPLGTVDDLMHYCTNPKAEFNSLAILQNRHEITVFLPNAFDDIHSSVTSMELLKMMRFC